MVNDLFEEYVGIDWDGKETDDFDEIGFVNPEEDVYVGFYNNNSAYNTNVFVDDPIIDLKHSSINGKMNHQNVQYIDVDLSEKEKKTSFFAKVGISLLNIYDSLWGKKKYQEASKKANGHLKVAKYYDADFYYQHPTKGSDNQPVLD